MFSGGPPRPPPPGGPMPKSRGGSNFALQAFCSPAPQAFCSQPKTQMSACFGSAMNSGTTTGFGGGGGFGAPPPTSSFGAPQQYANASFGQAFPPGQAFSQAAKSATGSLFGKFF